MRTTNPALTENTFRSVTRTTGDKTMTIQGAVNKTAILLALTFITAMFSWNLTLANPAVLPLLMWGGLIGGLIFALITIFKSTWAPATAPAYALFEGVMLGSISVMFEHYAGSGMSGIVFQAILLTFGTLAALLWAYTAGLIKVTEKFRMGVFAATGAIALVYLANIVMGFFGMAVPFLHDSGPIGIGISLVIVTVAALNLVLDFDFFEQGQRRGAPQYMEWYAAFGLLVTLVWLYLEILRLLYKLRSNR